MLKRVYWLRKPEEVTARPHRVSTRILGFGIFMVGVVTLSVGLIIGIEFPVYVYRRARKDQCILDKTHDLYEQWYRDERWSRYNRLYYWTVDNVEDVANGAKPKLLERGPYVYKEVRQLINVVFAGTRLSYQTMLKQEFSEVMTRQECGYACSETDELSVFNLDLLQRLHANKGLQYRQLVPLYVSHRLDTLAKHLPNNLTLFSYLGCLTAQCKESLANSTGIPASHTEVISFGAWLAQNDTREKSLLLENWKNRSTSQGGLFSERDMRGLYTTLIQSPFLNHSDVTSCTEDRGRGYWTLNAVPANYTSLANNSATEPVWNFSDWDSTVTKVNFSETCGVVSSALIFIRRILEFSEWPFLIWSFSMCEGAGKACADVVDTFEVVYAFLNLLLSFTHNYLVGTVSDLVTSQPKNQILQKRSQRDLALGYQTSSLLWDGTGTSDVKGILTHHRDFRDAFYSRPKMTVATCLDASDTNMAVREYNGSQFAPPDLFADGKGRVYSGFTEYLPASEKRKACQTPEPNSDHYDIFVEDLYRSFTFDTPEKTSSGDVGLFRFQLSQAAFQSTRGPCNTLDVTRVFLFPAVISNPYLQGSSCLGSHVTVSSHHHSSQTSYIDVEPWTGRLWKTSFRFQVNADIGAILNTMETGNIGINAQHAQVPFPVYWIDRRAERVQSETEDFNQKVSRMMAVSCGGLIGLIIVSILIMLVSIYVGLLSDRKKRIQPVTDEVSMTQRL